MTVIGIILLLGFGGLVGGVIGYKAAKKKFYTSKSKLGGGSSPGGKTSDVKTT